MGQQHKVGKTATTVKTVDGITTVRYHATDVVRFDATTIKLDTGGWTTATTKTRMNQTSAQFGLGYSVYQKFGMWFVKINGKIVKFDGDVVELKR